MQEWYLGREKVPCLERCPRFRGLERSSVHYSFQRLQEWYLGWEEVSSVQGSETERRVPLQYLEVLKKERG